MLVVEVIVMVLGANLVWVVSFVSWGVVNSLASMLGVVSSPASVWGSM